MTHPHQGAAPGIAVFFAAFLTMLLVVTLEQSSGIAASAELSGNGVAAAQAPVAKGVRITSRRAERLAERLHGAAPDSRALVSALDERDTLMRQSVTVRLYDPEGEEIGTETLLVSDHPTWVRLVTSEKGAEAILVPAEVSLSLTRIAEQHISAPSHCVIHGISEREGEKGYRKADTGGCVVRNGVTFDVEGATRAVLAALSENGEVPIILRNAEGNIHNITGHDFGSLSLLATGISNFKGSPWGRKMNIEKAFRDHLQNIIVEPGEIFSFNSTLGGPVTQSRGWHLALGIFGGGELRPTPGGGLCQASTTMFRVALDGGFPIVEQANHSLYVHYYEVYGVGQDATIFPGYRDFRFLNDTPGPILIQAYTDGDDAIVHIYGTPDGRKTELHGPFFAQNAPEGLTHNGRALRNTEIAWIRNITLPNGDTLEELFVSAYRSIPNAIRRKYTE